MEENKILLQTNKYQTSITDEYIKDIPQEVMDEFWDYINNVPFIQRLISPERKRAKDLDRDEEGKIIIDLSNPHILEDMDYFRETAIHFQKHGEFTKLRVNTHPHSEYMKWFKNEIWRCWYGMVRPEDGEWITGDLYFYLNYFPIIQTKIIEKGKARYGERVVDLPEVWEGVYWRYHYWEQAKKGGMYNDFRGNQHAVEIARRGAAHPYSQKVLTPEGYKIWGDIQVGDLLYGTNNDITKVVDIPFDDEDDIYTITLYDGRKIQSSLNHLWNVYKHSGSNRDVIYTMPLKDILKDYRRTRKISDRNPRGVEYIYSIPKNEGIEMEERPTKIDPYTFGLLLGDGTFAGNWISRVGFSSRKSDMEVYKRYIPYDIANWKNSYGIIIDNVKSILQEYNLYHKRAEFKFIPEEFKYNSRKVRMEILKGLMDTDGSVDRRGIPYIGLSSKRLIEDIQWICRSLGYNCSYTKNKSGYKKANGEYKECLPSYILRIYTNDPIFKLERKIRKLSKLESNYSKSKVIKTRIINIEYSHREKCKCVTVDSKDNSYLIGDFVQTHNSKSYSVGAKGVKNFILGIDKDTTKKVKSLFTAYNKEYLVKDGTLNKVLDGINFLSEHTEFPSRKLKDSLSDMQWILGWTDEQNKVRGSQNEMLGLSISDSPDKIRGKRSNVVYYEEFAVFPKFLDTWQIGLPNVQEGNIAFGQNIAIATGGSEGADFMGALEMLQYPKGYNVYALPNIYDKGSEGNKDTIFFFPGYINIKGFYNKDGVSDVTGAMLDELKYRYVLKYNSSDPVQLTRRRAETAFTIKDAIMQTGSTIYPVSDLNDRISYLDNNPSELQSMHSGKLSIKGGKVVWELDPNLKPILNYPHKDNKLNGCVYIKVHPIKDSSGQVPHGRYISGADTIETDGAETLSLFSGFILDLWTDDIVAEYTGREDFTDDSFEIYRRLLLYYNAVGNYESNKKGLFSHFSTHNSLHLLSDTLDYLKDKDPSRNRYGNSSKGTISSAPVKGRGRILIRDFLLKPYTYTKIEVVEGKEEEVEVTEPSLNRIKFRALLQELASHNMDGNFDRHDALIQLMLLREDRLRLLGDDTFENRYNDNSRDYLGDDDFFTDNFKEKDEDKLQKQLRQMGIV